MSELLGAVWEFILQRLDRVYLFAASVLTLATLYGQVLLDDITALSRNSGGLSPTLYTFAVVSKVITRGDPWSWIQDTSGWLTERSEVLHPAACLLLWGAGWVVGRQGFDSMKTKACATLILTWVLIVNTGGMSFGSWALLIVVFVGASLGHRDSNRRRGEEMVWAVFGVFCAATYSLWKVFDWLFGMIRSHTGSKK